MKKKPLIERYPAMKSIGFVPGARLRKKSTGEIYILGELVRIEDPTVIHKFPRNCFFFWIMNLAACTKLLVKPETLCTDFSVEPLEETA